MNSKQPAAMRVTLVEGPVFIDDHVYRELHTCRITDISHWTPAASMEEFADIAFDCGHSVTVSADDILDVHYCPDCGAMVISN